MEPYFSIGTSFSLIKVNFHVPSSHS